jgi:metal-sulfur cluster biosynthetic enzyme
LREARTLSRDIEATAIPYGDRIPRAKESTQEQVWDQLKTCYDPEIPVNIVDLGLVYACELTPLPDGGQRVSVRFTLTAPGCGMGDYLKQDIERKVAAVPGIRRSTPRSPSNLPGTRAGCPRRPSCSSECCEL